jgi:hypothetical protein
MTTNNVFRGEFFIVSFIEVGGFDALPQSTPDSFSLPHGGL